VTARVVQESNPPIRQVVISRSCKHAGCHWDVAGSAQVDVLAYVDTDAHRPAHELQYHIRTWNTYGRCGHAIFPQLRPHEFVLL
jgi:hypothetical protein